MKKYMVLCAGLCVALAFSSCKSSESAYKKAYEKAKAQETQTAAQGWKLLPPHRLLWLIMSTMPLCARKM